MMYRVCPICSFAITKNLKHRMSASYEAQYLRAPHLDTPYKVNQKGNIIMTVLVAVAVAVAVGVLLLQPKQLTLQ